MNPSIIVLGVLLAVAFAEQSPCQTERQKAIESDDVVQVVPECEENGEYAAKQCTVDKKSCQCVRRDGSPIVEMSDKIKACGCLRSKDDANHPRLIGNYKPQCEDDGTYRLYQCWGSVGGCWCVDENGAKLHDKHYPFDC